MSASINSRSPVSNINAQRAACEGAFGEAELASTLCQLAKIKTDVLQQHHLQYMKGDKSVVEVVGRIEELQHLLPSLVRSKVASKRCSWISARRCKKAA